MTTTDELTEEQQRARVRDIPKQCDGYCLWVWLKQEHRWSLRKLTPGCPRHWLETK